MSTVYPRAALDNGNNRHETKKIPRTGKKKPERLALRSYTRLYVSE
jgi:hypothetical protein